MELGRLRSRSIFVRFWIFGLCGLYGLCGICGKSVELFVEIRSGIFAYRGKIWQGVSAGRNFGSTLAGGLPVFGVWWDKS